MSLAGEALKGFVRIATEFKAIRQALAQRIARYDATGILSGAIEWQGTATAQADGTWTVAFPTGLFAKPPLVFTQAISPDKTVAATFIAAPWPATVTGCSGHIVTGNNITTVLISTGANGLKLAAAGVVVNVVARSVR